MKNLVKLEFFAGILLSVIALVCFVMYMLTGSFGDILTNFHEENGILEDAQAVAIITAFIIYTLASFKLKSSFRLIAIFFVILTYAFFLREVPFKEMNISSTAKYWLHGDGRTIFFACAFSILAVVAILNFKRNFIAGIDFLKSKKSCGLYVGFLLLVAGYVFERMSYQPFGQVMEEISELFGYLSVCKAALMLSESSNK